MKLYYILYCITALGTAVTADSNNQDVCSSEQLDELTDLFIDGLFNYNENVSEVGDKTSLLQGCQNTLQCAAGLGSNPTGKYWVVYDECNLTPRKLTRTDKIERFLHGGAWRSGAGVDFMCAVAEMRSRKGAPFDQIRGFATMDYRLSDLGDDGQGTFKGNKQGRRKPKPKRSQDLNRRQSQRRVRHPDHINDVRSAIQSLAQRMQMDKYILIGHSAGGTMAMQLLMGDAALQPLSAQGGRQGRQQTSTCQAGRNGTANSNQIPLPDAVITTAGIFDLPLLVDQVGPESKQFYTNFVTQAFGSRRADWRQASPATFAGNYKQMWPGNNVVMLARSPQDTLVDASQLDAMEKKLIADGITPTVVKNLTGQHDVVWQSGFQLAELLKQTLGELNARST